MYVETRPNLTATKFRAIRALTSDKWIQELLESMARMTIFRVRYHIVVPGPDDSSKWSRIIALERVGGLWRPGQKPR